MLIKCTRCNSEKDNSEFYKKSRYRKYPTSKAGYSATCKKCILAEREEYYLLNPEKRVAADRKQHLKRYGLTPEAYNELFFKQNGRCEGCKQHQNDFNRNFAVDHDHSTGKIRGLLCVGCNLILGYAEDNSVVLLNLIKYLDSNNSELADNNSSVVDIKSAKKVG